MDSGFPPPDPPAKGAAGLAVELDFLAPWHILNAVRTAAVALLAFFLLAAPSWPKSPGQGDLKAKAKVKVEAGFHGFIDPCPYSFVRGKIVTNFPYLYVGPAPSPSPLFVTLSAPLGLPLSGQVVVDVPDLRVPQRYVRAVALRPGETQRFEFCPAVAQAAIVTVLSDGRIVASAKAKATPFPFADPPALVVSDTSVIAPVEINPGNAKGIFLAYRRQARAGDNVPPGGYVAEKYVPPFSSYRIVFYPASPAEIPSNVLALRDFTAIAVSSSALSGMTGPRRDVLSRYARLGGRLLVYDCRAPGKARLGGRSFEYGGLPVKFHFDMGEVAFFESKESLRIDVRRIEEARLVRVFEMTRSPVSQVKFDMTSKTLGAIEFPSQPDLRNAFRVDPDLHPFSVLELFPPQTGVLPRMPNPADYYHPYWLDRFLSERFSPFSVPEFTTFSSSSRYRIAVDPSIRANEQVNSTLPSQVRTASRSEVSRGQASTVVVFVAAFALLTVVAASLRRYRPAAAVGVSAALSLAVAFLSTAGLKPPEYILFRTVTLLRAGAAGPALASENLYITSSSASRLRLTVLGEDALVLPLISDARSPVLQASVARTDERDYEIDFDLGQKTRILNLERAIPGKGRIVMRETREGERDFVILKNLTDISLNNAYFVRDQFVYPLGNLAPGEMARVNASVGDHYAKKHVVQPPLQRGTYFKDLSPKQQAQMSVRMKRGLLWSLYAGQLSGMAMVFGSSPVRLWGAGGDDSSNPDESYSFFPRRAGTLLFLALLKDGVFFDSFKPGRSYILAFPARLGLPPILIDGNPAKTEGEFNVLRAELEPE